MNRLVICSSMLLKDEQYRNYWNRPLPFATGVIYCLQIFNIIDAE
jgi:hypothetical protein